MAEIAFDIDGAEYVVTNGVGRREPWEIGKPYELHYHPKDPTKTLAFNRWQRLIFPAVFIGFGAICWLGIFGVITH
jgi:hypothetical protein